MSDPDALSEWRDFANRDRTHDAPEDRQEADSRQHQTQITTSDGTTCIAGIADDDGEDAWIESDYVVSF